MEAQQVHRAPPNQQENDDCSGGHRREDQQVHLQSDATHLLCTQAHAQLGMGAKQTLQQTLQLCTTSVKSIKAFFQCARASSIEVIRIYAFRRVKGSSARRPYFQPTSSISMPADCASSQKSLRPPCRSRYETMNPNRRRPEHKANRLSAGPVPTSKPEDQGMQSQTLRLQVGRTTADKRQRFAVGLTKVGKGMAEQCRSPFTG